jgi:hypothetical protein
MGLTYVSRGFIPCRTLATRRARSQSRLYRRSARCRWPEAAADASDRIDEHSAVVASPCSTTIECPSCKASSAASVFCASFELRKISFQPGPESCPRHVRDVTPPSCADAAVTAAESFTQSPRKSMPSRLSGPLTVPAARTWCRRAAQRTSTLCSIRISRSGLLRRYSKNHRRAVWVASRHIDHCPQLARYTTTGRTRGVGKHARGPMRHTNQALGGTEACTYRIRLPWDDAGIHTPAHQFEP